MIERSKQNWPKTENAANYLLFAERCLELVNPRVPHAYRVHALSTPLKIRELKVVCGKVRRREIPKISLRMPIDEVNEALRSDFVVADILKRQGLDKSVLEINFEESLDEIFSRTALTEELIKIDYGSVCEQLIVDLCKESSSRNKLLVISKLYVAHLCNSGFHKEYIFRVTLDVFFSDKVRRCSKGLLNRFFANFERKKEAKYEIYYCGSKRYVEFLAGIFGITAYDDAKDLPGYPIAGIPSNFGEGSEKKLIRVPAYGGRDPYNAVASAESFLSVPRAFIFIYPSGLKEIIDDRVYVIDVKKKNAFGISRNEVNSPTRSMSALSKTMGGSVKKFIKYSLSDDVVLHKNRWAQLLRSLNAAALASNSQDAETQLVSLWSAFEAILPSPSQEEGAGARIIQFAKLIVPCAVKDYIKVKFRDCARDGRRFRGKKFDRVLSDHGQGDTVEFRLASILLSSEEHQIMLLSEVSSSPLMLNRLWKLQKLISDSAEVVKKLTSHEKRVEWQVHRIYRERNEIVHSGATSPFLRGLTENAFVYYRNVIEALQFTYLDHGVAEPNSALQLFRENYLLRHKMIKAIVKNREIDETEKSKQIVKLLLA